MITDDAAASLAINPTEHVKSIDCLNYDDTALMMDGVSLADIAKTFGTPTLCIVSRRFWQPIKLMMIVLLRLTIRFVMR